MASEYVFPKWNPRRLTLDKILDNVCEKAGFKAFRVSCSGFVSKPLVRSIILEKCGNICVQCESKEKLEIDHIKSVHYCYKNNLIFECNEEFNLQVLCKKCNTSKLP